MNDQDWRAAMDSEIFREYVRNETVKLAEEDRKQKLAAEDEQVLEDFAQFQNEVRSSPHKLQAFRTLQKKFASDPDYAAKTKKSFVDAVMMLDLE